MAVLIDSLKDTIKDTVTLIPFLFITYLAMEWLEDKTEDQSVAVLSRISRFSHVLGAGIGLIPQCGFSAGAASLYSGGVITAGTLIAVFLSTSDEMIPIFISSSVAPATIGKILAAKFVIALISGIIIDAASRVIRYGFHADKHIHDLCEREHCGCEDEEGGIVRSAFIHTMKITGFIFGISLALSLLMGFAGRDTISSILTAVPLLGTIFTGIIGLIPNCAASKPVSSTSREEVFRKEHERNATLTVRTLGRVTGAENVRLADRSYFPSRAHSSPSPIVQRAASSRCNCHSFLSQSFALWPRAV